jgi:hypothetical protein
MDIEIDNFNKILAGCEQHFDKVFIDEAGKEYVFYGIVYGKDDLYYGMHPVGGGRSWLLSCVTNLETHGFKLKETNDESAV